jgi:hypothetical protein
LDEEILSRGDDKIMLILWTHAKKEKFVLKKIFSTLLKD